MSYDERVASPCIGAERADLVLAGCAILEAIRRVFPCARLRVADRGLREGMLVELMRADDVWAPQLRAVNARERAAAQGAAEDEEEPHRLAEALARAPAQRSLCGARQARRHALARRLQADRDRRQVSPAQARRARGRSRRRAGRLERDCGASASAAGEGRGKVVAIDILEMAPIAGRRRFVSSIFSIRRRPRASRDARRRRRCGALRHGGERDRPQEDRSAQDHGAGRGRRPSSPARCCGRAAASSPRCCRAAPSAQLLAELKRDFATVRHVKPQASRADSSELYLLATGFRGGARSA